MKNMRTIMVGQSVQRHAEFGNTELDNKQIGNIMVAQGVEKHAAISGFANNLSMGISRSAYF